ncbi:DUF547 domain-containing protein [Endozoicomonadaceae bacterium StTr2]
MIVILNRGFGTEANLEDRSLTSELSRLLDNAREHFYDTANRLFAYDAYARSSHFHDYRNLTRALTAFEPELLEDNNERKAFWLNLYNGLAINAVISHDLQEELQEHKLFYSQTCYQIGSHPWSLDHIEHGILRGNSPKYRALRKPFSKSHKVFPLLFEHGDPRIHAALYTPCQSSPMFSVFSSDYVDQQLDNACRNMIKNDVEISDDGSELYLPMIFKWYQRDFGSAADIVNFIARYMEDTSAAASLQQRMEERQLKLHYIPYSWVINTR